MYACDCGPQTGLVSSGYHRLFPCVKLTLAFDTSVRHPNYDDILEALLAQGLDNIEERVSLSVGETHCRLPGARYLNTMIFVCRYPVVSHVGIDNPFIERSLYPPRKPSFHGRGQARRPKSSDPCSRLGPHWSRRRRWKVDRRKPRQSEGLGQVVQQVGLGPSIKSTAMDH